MEDSISRNRSIPRLSFRPAKANAKKKTVSEEEITAEVQKYVKAAIDSFNNHHATNDFILAMMSCHRNGNSTCWERMVTPFFFACIVMEVDPFSFVQRAFNSETACIDQSRIKSPEWKIPAVGRVAVAVAQLLKQSYKEIKTRWDKRAKEQTQYNLYQGKKVVRIPACPSEEDIVSSMLFFRRHLYRLWISTPRAQEEDKRLEVLDQAILHLQTPKTEKEFSTAVETLVRGNLKAMIEIDDGHLLKENVPRSEERRVGKECC